MPIQRWHGWGAKCRECGEWIDISGDGHTAWEHKENVKDSLDIQTGVTIEFTITEACGCTRRKLTPDPDTPPVGPDGTV